MHIDFLKAVWEEAGEDNAIVWKGEARSFRWLLEAIALWRDRLLEMLTPGTVTAVEADFSPESVALLLALIEHNCIIVPMLRTSPEPVKKDMLAISATEAIFRLDEDDRWTLEKVESPDPHELHLRLRERNHPGLILFTSGSSGRPKAAIHDFLGLLKKFQTRRPTRGMLNFLLWDHWGGLNTLFHCLSNGGPIFTVQDRSPEAICELIERHRIEVLPASPTFLNLMLIGEAYRRYDLSSLKVITYGAEPMPQATLTKLHQLFPAVKLQQTYGLIELGVFRSRSRSSDSLWLKLDIEHRVVDGILEVKTESAMLGYLNAPSPFREDGWYHTGDAVEVEGEYLRILGRKSEMINVGGEKVFPQEVENVILEMDNIKDVTVYKEPNPITGSIVCAKVALTHEEEPKLFARRLKRHCRERLQSFKVPVKVKLVDESFMTARGKKARVQA